MMDRILLKQERRHLTGVSDVTWWRMEKRNEVPMRRQISPGRVGWLESEILAWMESRPVSVNSSPENSEATK